MLVCAIGNFDGVHLGHQAIVAAGRAAAGGSGRVVAVTFEPLHWPVADFTLVESVTDRTGSVYTPLASWKLQSCGA